ncbi:MAG: hypothetical protein ABSG56_04125 [Bryobacteraceae bacterium]
MKLSFTDMGADLFLLVVSQLRRIFNAFRGYLKSSYCQPLFSIA